MIYNIVSYMAIFLCLIKSIFCVFFHVFVINKDIKIGDLTFNFMTFSSVLTIVF